MARPVKYPYRVTGCIDAEQYDFVTELTNKLQVSNSDVVRMGVELLMAHRAEVPSHPNLKRLTLMLDLLEHQETEFKRGIEAWRRHRGTPKGFELLAELITSASMLDQVLPEDVKEASEGRR